MSHRCDLGSYFFYTIFQQQKRCDKCDMYYNSVGICMDFNIYVRATLSKHSHGSSDHLPPLLQGSHPCPLCRVRGLLTLLFPQVANIFSCYSSPLHQRQNNARCYINATLVDRTCNKLYACVGINAQRPYLVKGAPVGWRIKH